MSQTDLNAPDARQTQGNALPRGFVCRRLSPVPCPMCGHHTNLATSTRRLYQWRRCYFCQKSFKSVTDPV